MISNQQQFASTYQALFESQFAAFRELGNKGMKGLEKIAALNSSVIKEYTDESNAAMQQLMSAKDPQIFFALAMEKSKNDAEKTATYGRRLTEIVSGITAELTKATEAQIGESKNKVIALVDDIAKNAPGGSEQTVAIMKSAIDTTVAGYEQLTKASKQTAELVEAQVANATEQFSHLAEKAANKANQSALRK